MGEPGLGSARAMQGVLSPGWEAQFPSTRYQGSKAKIVDWIWDQVSALEFETCLDAFAGSGVVAYRLKREGKQVACNDILQFNYYIGKALVENPSVRLVAEDVAWLVKRHEHVDYPRFVQDTFSGIYFTDHENIWIDQMITNIGQLHDEYKSALAMFALCQACIIKRPYNLFHRKNLYMRLADVRRSFGNKATWDRPFGEWFRVFVDEANSAVFDNGMANRAFNEDAANVPGEYDLVYIDPPYLSSKGVGVDYWSFYHFLEGLTFYDEWAQHIDRTSKHRRLRPRRSEWTDKKRICRAFERVFERYKEAIIVVSYRSDGIPSERELVSLLKRYKRSVRTCHYGQYKYVLSKNAKSKEILLVGV